MGRRMGVAENAVPSKVHCHRLSHLVRHRCRSGVVEVDQGVRRSHVLHRGGHRPSGDCSVEEHGLSIGERVYVTMRRHRLTAPPPSLTSRIVGTNVVARLARISHHWSQWRREGAESVVAVGVTGRDAVETGWPSRGWRAWRVGNGRGRGKIERPSGIGRPRQSCRAGSSHGATPLYTEYGSNAGRRRHYGGARARRLPNT